MDTIGKRLASIRNQLGLSLTDVTNKLNMDKSNLSRIENDKHEPTSGTLAALVKLYGVSADWILFGEGNIIKEENALFNEPKPLPPPPVITAYFNKLTKLWHDGDKDIRGWIKVQLRKAFPEIAEEIKKEQEQAAAADTA